MTEQEATNKLERLVGSVDGCFRLMRIYQSCKSTVSGDRYDYRRSLNPRNADDVFRTRAKSAGYSDDAIRHYLQHIR